MFGKRELSLVCFGLTLEVYRVVPTKSLSNLGTRPFRRHLILQILLGVLFSVSLFIPGIGQLLT